MFKQPCGRRPTRTMTHTPATKVALSPPPVYYILNHPGNVSTTTIERGQHTLQALNPVPHTSAQELIGPKANTLAFAARVLSPQSVSRLWTSITMIFREAGFERLRIKEGRCCTPEYMRHTIPM